MTVPSTAASLSKVDTQDPTKAVTVIPTQPQAPLHVLSILRARPDPKEISRKNKKVLDPKADKHKMDAAGGYLHVNFARRNWREIALEVKNLVLQERDGAINGGADNRVGIVPGTGAVSRPESWPWQWPMQWD
jgi:hypothetical protein